MKREITKYVAKCNVCQQVKVEHQNPVGPLQSLLIPEWKWEDITMNFMFGLPEGREAMMLFLPMKMIYSVEKLAKLHVVVRLHGVPILMVLDLDPRFTS